MPLYNGLPRPVLQGKAAGGTIYRGHDGREILVVRRRYPGGTFLWAHVRRQGQETFVPVPRDPHSGPGSLARVLEEAMDFQAEDFLKGPLASTSIILGTNKDDELHAKLLPLGTAAESWAEDEGGFEVWTVRDRAEARAYALTILRLTDDALTPCACCILLRTGQAVDSSHGDRPIKDIARIEHCPLHVATPELLEGLKEALAWCLQDATNEDGHPTQDMLDARVARLRRLVAKTARRR